MKFAIYQASRIGGRKYNQDRVAYAYSDQALLLMLADGMGGHQHGEVAARIAVDTFMQAFAQAAQPRVPEPQEFLRENMQHAHEAIIHYARTRQLGGNPGTTCVVALVQDGQMSWAHAGDSRCYLLRGGKVAAVTHDHSMVQQWVDWGIIKPEKMRVHPDRNKITNCLGGVEEMFRAELDPAMPLLPGDVILLCSDGLWGPLDEAGIAAAFSIEPIAAALDQLLDKALLQGGVQADNTTAVVARWGDAGDEHSAPSPVCVVLDVEQQGS